MFLEILLLLLLFTYWYINASSKSRKYLPPGPFAWPIVGNLIQLSRANPDFPYLAMEKLAKKYGEIMSLKFGCHDAIVLSSYEAIKELNTKEEFAGRYDGFPFGTDRSFGKPIGIIFSSGDMNSKLRRYTLRTLRDFGFGKRNSMSHVMSEELGEFTALLQKQLQSSSGALTINPDLFSLSFVNLVWAFIAGERFSHSNEQLKGILKLTDETIRSWDVNNISVPFPKLRFLFPKYTNYHHQMEVFTALQDYMRALIRKMKAAYEAESDGSPRSFIEDFLQEIKNSEGNSNIFTEEQLIIILNDLFLGGSETTSNTLTYALLYMILYPNVQRKIQQEISTVLEAKGKLHSDEILELSDLAKMPYTEATIAEVFRISHLVPTPVPRKVLGNYVYKNYFIPEGTCVFFNLAQVMMNSEYWGDPETFRPERFLDPSGTKVINTERVIPFGYGKRVCIAESMARESFFIYLTHFLRKYTFSLPPGTTAKPSTEPLINFTLRPADFDALLTLRE